MHPEKGLLFFYVNSGGQDKNFLASPSSTQAHTTPEQMAASSVSTTQSQECFARVISIIVIERHEDWHLYPPTSRLALDHALSTAAGLSPNKIHLVRMPHLPFAVSGRDKIGGHHSLYHD